MLCLAENNHNERHQLAMSIPSVHTDSVSEQDYIRETLQKRPLFCFFPAAMEAEFLEKRVESSQYYIRSGHWPLLAMFMLIGVIAWTFFKKFLLLTTFNSLNSLKFHSAFLFYLLFMVIEFQAYVSIFIG